MAVGIENPSKTIVYEPRAQRGKDLKFLICMPPIAVGAECPFKRQSNHRGAHSGFMPLYLKKIITLI
jgi:hypothetical protein